MHSLHLRVIEEIKTRYFFAEGSAVDKVGVEKQPDDVVRHLVVGNLDLDRLTRSESDDGAFLIVILAASVFYDTVDAVFEKQRIDAIGQSEMIGHFDSFLEIDDRDERMTCGQSVELVICIDRVECDGFLFHVANIVFIRRL